MKMLVGLIFLLLSLSFINLEIADKKIVDDGDWIAPNNTNSYNNPYLGDASAIASGKKLYNSYCGICHGGKGKGDGIGGISLKPRPSNFTAQSVQSQSDGAIFWKLKTGRAPMAGYEGILNEEEMWQLVNYIRTFKK